MNEPDLSTGFRLELQVAGPADGLPAEDEIRGWLADAMRAATKTPAPDCEIVVRVVDEAESRELNRRYRLTDRPTNVLAFPAAGPQELADIGAEEATLGDLVLCGPVIAREAAEQRKELVAHWAHMLVHGTLHLLGYEHETDEEAARMERLEARVLAGRGIDDPYAPR